MSAGALFRCHSVPDCAPGVQPVTGCDSIGCGCLADLTTPSLGCYASRYADPLERLFRAHRPSAPLPGFVRCEARRNPSVKGLRRCRTVICSACHGEVQRRRHSKLLGLVADAVAADVGLRFLTLTIQHDAARPLRACAAAIIGAWKSSRVGSPIRRLKKAHRFLGCINVIELKHGLFGWHAHIHALVFACDASGAAQSGAKLAARYRSALKRAGFLVFSSTAKDKDADKPLRLTGYLAKDWRYEAGSPFELLKKALAGCKRAGELFLEAADFLHGLRSGVISAPLRKAVDARLALAGL